uniref:Uncharacterized protein n=1 Tax=Macaca mulatta TaxID=9544 RepID=A0A5F8ARA0_MACMU
MVQDNHLSSEASCFHWWVVFAVTSNVATMNILDRHILDIEAHIVARKSFTQSFMVHFDRFYFSCNTDCSKGDHHTGFENTSHSQQEQYQYHQFCRHPGEAGLKGLSVGRVGGSTGIAILTGDLPSLEPRHVSTWLQHVVTIPTRNWHKCYCVGVVANFLNVSADFLNNFLISLLAVGWLSGIHFVNANN